MQQKLGLNHKKYIAKSKLVDSSGGFKGGFELTHTREIYGIKQTTKQLDVNNFRKKQPTDRSQNPSTRGGADPDSNKQKKKMPAP